MIDFNPKSAQHLSFLFFGGEIKTKSQIAMTDDNGIPVVIKTGPNKGQPKLKSIEFLATIKGLGLHPLKEWETKREGTYSTDDATLEVISRKPETEAGQIAIVMRRIREKEKQLSTYYDSVKELVYDVDMCLHSNFQHTATNTGRLSCTKPNIQNQPDREFSKAKEHFTSRFVPSGNIIAADYSQLEICIQAQLSKDQNYIEDIKKGIDFHCKRLALKEGVSYDTIYREYKEGNQEILQRRSNVKAFSFARAYGAGITKICTQTGLEENEVKKLIENEDKEYPFLK